MKHTFTRFLTVALVSFSFAPAFALAFDSDFGSTATGLRNPLIRFCVINGGTFEVYPYGSDDMALCRWDRTLIDSLSIVENLDGRQSSAVNVVMNEVIGSSCGDVGARAMAIPQTPDSQVICIFSDDSKLALETVQAGTTSPERTGLKDVLLAR